MQTNLVKNKRILTALAILLVLITLPIFTANTFLMDSASPRFTNVQYTFALTLSDNYIRWTGGLSWHNNPNNMEFRVLIVEGTKEVVFVHDSWDSLDWYSDSARLVSTNRISLQDKDLADGYHTIFVRSAESLGDWVFRGSKPWGFFTHMPYTWIPYYHFIVSAWQFLLPEQIGSYP